MPVNLISRPDITAKNINEKAKKTELTTMKAKYPDIAAAHAYIDTKVEAMTELVTTDSKNALKEMLKDLASGVFSLSKGKTD